VSDEVSDNRPDIRCTTMDRRGLPFVLGERCRLRTCVLRDEDAADVSMDRAWTNAMHAVRAYASLRPPGHVDVSTRRDTRRSGGQGVAGSNPVSPTEGV